jgi:hypothetical protein
MLYTIIYYCCVFYVMNSLFYCGNWNKTGCHRLKFVLKPKLKIHSYWICYISIPHSTSLYIYLLFSHHKDKVWMENPLVPKFDTNDQLSCLQSAVFLSSTRVVSPNTRISSSMTELLPPLPEPHNINIMEQYLPCAKDEQYYIYDMQSPSRSLTKDKLCRAEERAFILGPRISRS